MDTIVEVDLCELFFRTNMVNYMIAGCKHVRLSLLEYKEMNEDFKKLYDYVQSIKLNPKFILMLEFYYLIWIILEIVN